LCFTLFITLPFSLVLMPLSVALGIKKYPRPISWIHTSNDDLDGGQEQAGYRKRVKGWELAWQRICWVWRNPSSGFFSEVLGIPKQGTTLAYSEMFEGGFYNEWKTADGRRYFGYRRNLPIGRGYLKMWFGWRYYPGDPQRSKHPDYYDLCLDLQYKTS
jgi:hypothetical protein